jgi:hypothetical protein
MCSRRRSTDICVIVNNFLRSHAGLYGLAPADVSTIEFKGESGSRGLRVLRGEQVIDGIPVFQSDTRFILDDQGRLIRALGAFVPVAAATAAGTTPGISLAAALVARCGRPESPSIQTKSPPHVPAGRSSSPSPIRRSGDA